MKTQHNWPTTSLGEVLIFIGNGTTAEQNKSGKGLPVTRIETIADEQVDSNRVGYIENPGAELVERYRIEPGDVLFSHINSEPQIGRAVVYKSLPPVLLHGMNLLRLRFNADAAAPEFMVYLFRHYRENGVFISLASRAVGQSSINQGRLKSLQIQLPPLLEQRAIAHVLQTVQKAEEARQRELALERERKAALMEHLFTHGTRGEATKQSEIGEIPESWEAKPLRLISTIRYGLGQPPQLDPQGVPMIRATDVKRGRIMQSGILRVKREAIPDARNPFLCKGDIIVVRSGAYTGDVALYGGRWETAIAGYDLVVSPTSEQAESGFLSEYLLGESAQRYFRSQSDRAAQAHLNAQQLGDTPIPLPSLDEQMRIGELLGAVNAKSDALERELALLEELFSALLEELMTGRISTASLQEATAYHE